MLLCVLGFCFCKACHMSRSTTRRTSGASGGVLRVEVRLESLDSGTTLIIGRLGLVRIQKATGPKNTEILLGVSLRAECNEGEIGCLGRPESGAIIQDISKASKDFIETVLADRSQSWLRPSAQMYSRNAAYQIESEAYLNRLRHLKTIARQNLTNWSL